MKTLPLLLLLAAAGRAPAAPAGSVQFVYQAGGPAETYTAHGALPAMPYALGLVDTRGSVMVHAYRNAADGSVEAATLGIEQGAQGSTYSFDNEVCGRLCPDFNLGLGLTAGNVSDGLAWVCTLDKGSVQITSRTSDHISGMFSGTGQCTSPDGASERPFSVTSGTFSVPLQPE